MAKLHEFVAPNESPEELGARDEEAVQDWFDFKGCCYVYIDQQPETFSASFYNEEIKRPDWFVIVNCMGSKVIIAVDAKSRTYNKQYGNYTLDENKEVQKLLNFQRKWGVPVWLTLASPVEPFTRHWISLTKIVKVIELKKNGSTGNQFRAIKIKDCITIGWNDGLEKLFSSLL